MRRLRRRVALGDGSGRLADAVCRPFPLSRRTGRARGGGSQKRSGRRQACLHVDPRPAGTAPVSQGAAGGQRGQTGRSPVFPAPARSTFPRLSNIYLPPFQQLPLQLPFHPLLPGLQSSQVVDAQAPGQAVIVYWCIRARGNWHRFWPVPPSGTAFRP